MSARTGCFLSVAVFFLLVWGTMRSGTGAARAAVIPVTPANVQANIDALPEGTPESSRPKSLQAIIEDAATYVGDEDALEFAPGTYDDVGELLIGRPLTLRKDPAADGEAVITGELVIQIRSKDVKIEGLTFRDVELGKVTILREGERGRFGAERGPFEVYFGDVTIQSFLLDRKAKVVAYAAGGGDTSNCPAALPDCGHDYGSYTGQLHRTELRKHIDNRYLNEMEFFAGTLLSDKDGFPRGRFKGDGTNTKWDPEDDAHGTDGKWALQRAAQWWMRDNVGHILINPRWYPESNNDPCPESEAFTGIEITRNTFDGTEVRAVWKVKVDRDGGGNIESSGLFQQRAGGRSLDCVVDVDIVGNTFRNIGVADHAFLVARDENGIPRADSDGNPVFLMDEDGNRILNHNEDEYAIELADAVRNVTISDNTIEGPTTYGHIRLEDILKGGRVTISNNLLSLSTEGGYGVVDSPLGIIRQAGSQGDGGADEDIEIMIRGNRIISSDSGVSYQACHYDTFHSRLTRECGDLDARNIVNGTTIGQLDTWLEPTIWQSYVPNFPYPPLNAGGEVVDADEGTPRGPSRGTPVRLRELTLDSHTVGSQALINNVRIGPRDIVRYKSCNSKKAVLIHGQKGVSVVDNDIGYGGAGELTYAIQLSSPQNVPVPRLEKFSGNNIDNYVSLVGAHEGAALSTRGSYGVLATEGNYIGLRPAISSSVTANREGELGEPIARGEGDVGPRTGMTVDDPPLLPRITGASVSESDRKMIVVAYSAELDGESAPSASAFRVRHQLSEGTYTYIAVSGLGVSGNTVTLTLESGIPVDAGALTVIYTAPGGAAAVRSEQGGLAARTQSSVVTDAAGPDPDTSAPDTSAPDASAGGDGGGCALASSQTARGGLRMFAPLATVMALVFGLRKANF